MIAPAAFQSRPCAFCPTILGPTTERTIITILRTGMATVMLLEACTQCANVRLADGRCVNMGRRDAAQLWDVFARDGDIQAIGGGNGG